MVRFWRKEPLRKEVYKHGSLLYSYWAKKQEPWVFFCSKRMVLTMLLVEQEPGLTSLHGLFRRNTQKRWFVPKKHSEKNRSSWREELKMLLVVLFWVFLRKLYNHGSSFWRNAPISQRYDSSTIWQRYDHGYIASTLKIYIRGHIVVISLLYRCYIVVIYIVVIYIVFLKKNKKLLFKGKLLLLFGVEHKITGFSENQFDYTSWSRPDTQET